MSSRSHSFSFPSPWPLLVALPALPEATFAMTAIMTTKTTHPTTIPTMAIVERPSDGAGVGAATGAACTLLSPRSDIAVELDLRSASCEDANPAVSPEKLIVNVEEFGEEVDGVMVSWMVEGWIPSFAASCCLNVSKFNVEFTVAVNCITGAAVVLAGVMEVVAVDTVVELDGPPLGDGVETAEVEGPVVVCVDALVVTLVVVVVPPLAVVVVFGDFVVVVPNDCVVVVEPPEAVVEVVPAVVLMRVVVDAVLVVWLGVVVLVVVD